MTTANEPVAWMVEDDEDISFIMNGKGFAKPDASWKSVTPVYAHPVNTLELTEDEIDDVWAACSTGESDTIDMHLFAEAILRKAQEK